MKTIPVSFLVAGMLLPAVGLAQPPPPDRGPGEGGPGPHGRRPFGEIWKKIDTNGDGFLTMEEFSAMPRIQNIPEEKRTNLFKRIDKDGDGKLSREEMEKFGRPKEGERRPMRRLWELDTDKSGGISFEEFKAGELFKKLPLEKQQALFKKLDTDGDGFITPKDRPEPPFKRPDGKRPPMGPDGGPPGKDNGRRGPLDLRLDKDGDGALSFEEFRAGRGMQKLTEDQQEDRFEKLDRDSDLKLTPKDFPPPPPPHEGPGPEDEDGPPMGPPPGHPGPPDEGPPP